MDALKRSMEWDEEAYGREYDLDRFMIVAVDDFNMGAMENKGLNVFNSKYVLASPETATDADYKGIEAVIAHEYFHNWTGNRITCRDWFQLCLKEGLTVFRDQQFSGDQRSHGVKRIEDVIRLRGQQFREDAGPLAHPVRPEEYVEINNFYTATVYEKGAEVIGMLRRLVGPETYRQRARPLLRAPRRPGLHHRGLARRSSRTPRAATSRSSSAGTRRPARPRLTRRRALGRRPLHPRPRPGDAADAGPAGQGAAGRCRSPSACSTRRRRRSPRACWSSTEPRAVLHLGAARAAGALAAARLLRAGHPRARRRAGRARLPARPRQRPVQQVGGRPRLRAGARCPPRRRPRRGVDADYLAALAAVADDDAARPGLQGARPRPAVRGRDHRRTWPRRAASPTRSPSTAPAGRSRPPRPARSAAGSTASTPSNAVPGPYSPDAGAAGHRALRARALAFLTALDPDGRAARARSSTPPTT